MKRRMSIVAGLLVVSLVALIVGGCTTPPPENGDEEEPIVLRYATWLPPGHIFELPAEAFLIYIEEASEGRIIFERHYGQTLVAVSDSILGTIGGACDLAHFGYGYCAGTIPPEWLAARPFSQQDFATTACADLEYFTVNLRSLTREHFGVEFVMGTTMCPYQLFSKAIPINKLEDFVGTKQRATGGTMSAVMQALGATPVSSSMSDAAVGFERGTLEVSVAPPAMGVASGWHEICEYLVLGFNWQLGISAVVVNGEIWDELSQDLKDIWGDAKYACLERTIKSYFEFEEPAVGQCEAAGMTITTFPPAERERLVELMQTQVWPVLESTMIAAGWPESPEWIRGYYEVTYPEMTGRGETMAKWRTLLGYD